MDHESAIGQSFGNYRVVRVLGRGGMGVVYLAEHTLLGRQAVVKQLLPELSSDQDNLQRFFNEARAATMIKHPGIVDVFDFGQHPTLGSAFIVMEFLDGESLASRIERERILPIDLATYVTRQIASPLGAAHAVGIVHRDLKPDNVYLARDPDAPHGIRVKVLDFGIAKLAGQMSAGGVKTRTGAVLGTPRYMSPEQCHGAAQLDHRADIYSLGCILFEMVCGRPPFTGQGLGEVLGAHMYQEPPRPSTIAHVPPSVDEIVLAMLAKAPDARPQTAEAVIAALDEFRRSAQGPAVVPSASGPMPVAAPRAPTNEAATIVPIVIRDPTPRTFPPAPSPAPVTTLRGAAGVVAPTAPPARAPGRPRWIVPAALGVVALGGVVAVIATRGGGDHAAVADKVTGTSRGPARVEPPPAAPAAPPAPKTSDAPAACDHGDAGRCVEAGLAELSGATPDAIHALAHFDVGCKHDVMAACGQQARLLLHGAPGVGVDAVHGVVLATRACDAKDGVACAWLAIAASEGDGMTISPTLVEPASATACDAKVGLGCKVAVDLALVAGDRAKATALARTTLPLLHTECDAGEDLACLYSFHLVGNGVGGKGELAASVRDIQTACDRNDGEACVVLAEAVDHGTGVTPDRDRADKLRALARAPLAKACDLGRASSCAQLGLSMRDDPAATRDPATRASVLVRACYGGYGRSCVQLALMTLAGDGVRKDAQKGKLLEHQGRTLLEAHCQSSDPDACMWASNEVASGFGGARDDARSAELDRVGCSAGSSKSCLRWGDFDAARTAEAYRAARDLGDPACDAGDLEACVAAAVARCDGPPELKDQAACTATLDRVCTAGVADACFEGALRGQGDASLHGFERSCDLGRGQSCDGAGYRLRGKGSVAEAAKLFERSCDLGWADGCSQLSIMIGAGQVPGDARLASKRACVLGSRDDCR